MTERKITQADLMQFTGTENWYQHGLVKKVSYTDGVKYLAEMAGAYWLIDEIALCQIYENAVKAEEFQAWTLLIDEETSSAQLKCTDGNERVLFSKHITFTDFPLQKVQLYFTNNVLLLTSEY